MDNEKNQKIENQDPVADDNPPPQKEENDNENDVEEFKTKLESHRRKTAEMFEADPIQPKSFLSDPREFLKIRLGTRLLSGYKNISMIADKKSKKSQKSKNSKNGILGEKREIEEGHQENEFQALEGLIDELIPLTNKKLKTQNINNNVSRIIQQRAILGAGKLSLTNAAGTGHAGSTQIVLANTSANQNQYKNNALQLFSQSERGRLGAVYIDKIKRIVKPKWHAPWKLKKVIAGHQQWVRCIDFDPMNEWFVTGSNDRTIKIWDLASGKLKLTLTGHINAVRDVVVDPTHTYMYSCSEDKTVKCWDLVQNKAIRNYHGHLSGVYTMAMHPTLNLIASGGRDSTVRIWDIRTKYQVRCLEGHRDTVQSIIMQEFEPQVVSGASDQTIRTWDLATGKRVKVLTNHKKSIRSMIFHHEEYTFCSAGGDNLKVWKCPEARFLRNFSGHKTIINSLALNEDNVLVSAGDNGSLYFWDWKSGYNFQRIMSRPQPGSIASEAGIFSAKFDRSGLRLITCECDKTIKIWCEDEEATPSSHPIDPNYRGFMKARQS